MIPAEKFNKPMTSNIPINMERKERSEKVLRSTTPNRARQIAPLRIMLATKRKPPMAMLTLTSFLIMTAPKVA